MRFLLLLLVTHTRAAPLDPQVEQRELHNEAKTHHRFAAWAESHGWHQDGHEKKSERNDEGGDNMLSAASLLTAPQAEQSCGGLCSSDKDCASECPYCEFELPGFSTWGIRCDRGRRELPGFSSVG